MTTETFTPASPYTISGTGPYAIPFEYSDQLDIKAEVVDGDTVTLLTTSSYTISPTTYAASGNLTLTSGAATTHAGKTLSITRATRLEQGWVGNQTSRERGLERQIDINTRHGQDIEQFLHRVPRLGLLNGPLDPALPAPLAGAILIGTEDGWVNGPTVDSLVTVPSAIVEFTSAAALRDYVGSPLVVGTTIRTRLEGFIYSVVSSGQHLTNANGDKLTVDLTGSWHNAKKWWIYPTNTPTQNDAALIAMRNSLRSANNERLWRILWEPGLYQYTDNKWTRGIKYLEISGYGVILQNTSNAAFTIQRTSLDEGNYYFETGDSFTANPTYFGSYIATVAAGNTAITCLTPAEAASFPAGSRVVIMSRDVQFVGFPPNMGRFQYTRVVSSDAGTGVIVLEDATTDEYRSDHPFQTSGAYANTGKARIMNLDRGLSNYVFPAVRIFRGLTFRKNPNLVSIAMADNYYPTGGYVLWEDIQFDSTADSGGHVLSPSQANVVILRRLSRVGKDLLRADVDKMVNSLLVEDCRITGQMGGGTGVRRSVFRRNTFSAVPNYSGQVDALFEDNDFNIPAAASTGAFLATANIAPGRLRFRGNRFSYAGSSLPYIVNDFSAISAQPSSVSGTTILYFDPGTTAGADMARAAREGGMIWASDLSDIGTIQQVTQDGSGVRIAVNWFQSATPSTAKSYLTQTKEGIFDEGGNTKPASIPFFRGRQNPTHVGSPGSAYQRMQVRSGEFSCLSGAVLFLGQDAPKIIRSVRARVLRAYTGATATASIFIACGNNLTLDLKTLGVRTWSQQGNQGLVGTDAGNLTNIFAGACQLSASAFAFTDPPTQKAIVELEVEYSLPVVT